ncbi:hypothetical protein EDB92DRAFT_1843172 [Lactarius akahatsu]|uniref:SPT2 chromatin protein n=1 Tax=Lactarius akahatsu TaxID=416441 RepID=A0AAD4QAG3_9AGAM|nr:hypothetical protein EDB92DRAFT_1843172 [Lactarius akahatsu]
MTSRGFAALMALSQAQTQESTRAADSIQAERRRKEEARRLQQEEEDRKERERQAKLLRHRLEEQKREKEKQEKREREQEAQLKEMGRREEEQRQALLYGPRRAKDGAPRHQSSSTTSKQISGDVEEADMGLALTREEKRERRLQLQFSQNAARRAGYSAGISRVGRRLPGGAVNVTASSQTTDGSAGGTHSVRARLTAMPNTLTKLNTVKRDTRTIDEILRDRAKARENKTLEGEDAREFHDWFGTKPMSGTATKTSSSPSPAASGASTPSKPPYRPDSMPSMLKRPSPPRPSGSRAPSLPVSRPTPKTVSKSSSLSAKLSRPSSGANKAPSGSSAPLPKKRARTPPSAYSGSESDSEYDHHPRKRAPAPTNGIQNEIWKIFGRDRSKYVARDVVSDDEDMEADVVALEREEFVSTRIARKEDLEAEEEERRHEEEKRRRRKERERASD